MAVTAVRRAARAAGQQPPDRPFTHQAIEGFRRAAAADTPAHRGQARGLTADECAAILATCMQRRRTGRGLERTETAARRGRVDSATVELLFHGTLRRSEVAALRWAGVDLSDAGGDVVVTVRRSKTDPTGGRADVRRLVDGCAAAVRTVRAVAVGRLARASRHGPERGRQRRARQLRGALHPVP
jgi:integrase